MYQTITRSFFLLALTVTLGMGRHVQAQSLDASFQATDMRTDITSDVFYGVNTLAVDPDGRVLVAGGFDFIAGGAMVGKLQRFLPDGTPNLGFSTGTGANGFISAVVRQPDGKYLVGGGFTTFNGQPRPMVVRLNYDGSLDNTFTFATAASIRQISSLALQPDGKILVGSGRTLNDGPQTGGLVRLHTDGSLDTSFSVGTGITQFGTVAAIQVQADGKIVVGGSFTEFNGQPIASLVRLTSTGALDTSFPTTNTIIGSVRALAQQADGKLVVGGSFTQFRGYGYARLARLLPNGEVDETFQYTAINSTVRAVQSDRLGNVVIAGDFTQVGSVVRNRVARLYENGKLDPTFGATGTAADQQVSALGITTYNQVVLGGSFSSFGGTAATGVARLNAVNGQLEADFLPVLKARGTIARAVATSDNKLLVTGNFTQFNGQTAPGATNAVRRIHADGTLDANFAPAFTGIVHAPQADGSFYLLTGTVLRRLLASGAVDNAFTAQAFTNSPNAASVLGATALPGGKLLVFGRFTGYGSRTGLSGLICLNADGSVDNSFTATGNSNRLVRQVLVQPGGKIVVAAEDISSVPFLTRLNADGSADTTFSTGTAAGPGVTYQAYLQPDGRLLVGGLGVGAAFNGQSVPFGLTRLTVDGAVDATYSGISASYAPLIFQADGRLLANRVPSATNVSTTLVRLNTDGSPDGSFNPVATASGIFTNDNTVSGAVLQSADSKILLYGSFRYVAGQVRIGLARLTNVGILATRTAAAVQPLDVYPNPTHGTITVALPAAAQARPATLLDILGRPVRTWTVPARQRETTLDLEAVPAGVYLLRVEGESAVYQQKVIVTR